MNIKPLIIILFSIFLMGCKNNTKKESDKLSNEIALEILNNNFSNNCYQKLLGGKYSYNGTFEKRIDKYKNNRVQEFLTILQNLESKGLVRSIENRQNHLKFILSNKTNEFKKANSKDLYLIAKSEVTEIIGIANNENSGTAIVRFKYKLTPTDLYEIRYYYNNQNKDNCKLQEYESELEFIKFDTGWQIKK